MPTRPHAPPNMPAPLSDEPDALRVVFNAARRKAFYNLVCSITAYMRSQLELERRHEEEEEGGGGGNEGDQGSTPPPPYTATDADGEGSSGGGNARPQPRRDGDGLSSPALVRLRRAALLHFDSWRAETLSKLKEVAAKPDDQRIVDARRKRAEELSSSAKAREEEEKRRRRNGGSGGGSSSSSAGDLLVFDDADAPAEGKPTNSNSNSNSSSSNSGGGVGGGAGGSSSSSSTAELEAFQELYHPIPTRLTTVPLRDREEALSATLLLLLSGGRYSAHSRALACHLTSALGVAPSTLDGEERAIATTMAATARKASASASASASGSSGSSGSGTMSADAEAQRRRDEGRAGRLWKVGLASVAGAALVGVTGGLAAPVVAAAVGGLMSSVGLGGLAGFLGLFWMNGALVGTLFGAFGAKMTGEIADRYAKEVEDFRFLPLDAEWGEDWKDDGDGDGQAEARRRRLRVTIGVNGWLESEDDVTRPWRALGDETEVFALRYEMGSLTALGGRLRALVGSAAWGAARAQVLRRTALATLQGALWPVLLLRSAAAGVDNPFALARHRSDKAGRVLADALAARVQGERPVTLVGYSLGARVVWACLRALADRRAFGLVDSVVLIGAPVPSSPAHWAAARSVVAGRLVNVHSANDYVLGLLHRGTSLQLGVAGLQAVGGGGGGVGGVEDLDLTDQVHGHLRYPGLIPQILHRCGFPNVKGGGAPIETEKEVAAEIELRDRDYAELGTLIDIGEEEEEETPPPPLPRRTVGDRLNDKFDPTVKNVLELKSDAQTRDAKLMGRAAAVSGLHKTGLAAASSPSTSDSLVGGGRERSASISHSAAAGGQSGGHGVGDRDDDSDEYGEGQITMVDDDELSDGELTMVEPLSIDDDDPQAYTTV
ncbi:putative transmembrane and coiled-coil domain-containing protein [Rosellinia necatrix]|uniref:Putative transmembrane and coiled-coil domain-containing protein n=1 Tax=Rosellinia necatrix TaxID=77044 RepID=A0A1W2TIJ8_ROSNE|nr:putative transmembrane and coiled-coil domain-containing protein [Rosellinia necatrix]